MSSQKMTVPEIVLKRIMDQMEAGVVPWHRPWQNGLAKNLVSGRAYTGTNQMLLGSDDRFSSPYWLTYNQNKQLLGTILEGEQSTPVIFLKSTSYEDKDTGKKKAGRIMRFYNVWNVEQTYGIDHKRLTEFAMSQMKTEVATVEAADAIVAGYTKPPSIAHDSIKAYYVPSTDEVHMPKRADFETSGGYYGTLFHELCHSTGHEKRLHRKTGCRFDNDHSYSMEELVAELGAAILCAEAGVSNERLIENTAAYIDGWLTVFRDKPETLMSAASAGGKAVLWITGGEEE